MGVIFTVLLTSRVFSWNDLFVSACIPHAKPPASPLLFTMHWRKLCIFYSCWFSNTFEVSLVCNPVLCLSTKRRRQHPGGFFFVLAISFFMSRERISCYLLMRVDTGDALEENWWRMSLPQGNAHMVPIPCLGGKEKTCMPWYPCLIHQMFPQPAQQHDGGLFLQLGAEAVFRGNMHDCQEQLLQQLLYLCSLST